ncbi:hypothetical protein KR009_011452 [Drosophila setifemur]|nr:hypothetical protein KR009_011452 [Drosophila setifemur]
MIADPRPRPRYVSDFAFPSEDEHQGGKLPVWELITFEDQSGPIDYNGKQRGVWVMSDLESQEKCRTYHINQNSGHVRLIFISYKTVDDPLESLKEVFIKDLNLPEIVDSLRIVKLGRQRLIFELPNAIDALFTLENFCDLYYSKSHINYEILSAEDEF